MDEDDEEMIDQNVTTYDYRAYDESDDDQEMENSDDEDDKYGDKDRESYEHKMYGYHEGLTDPYHPNHKSEKRLHLEKRNNESPKSYLNKMRLFLVDEIRKVENKVLESYRVSKDQYKFDNESTIEEIKTELFKDKFCFLLKTESEFAKKRFSFKRDKKQDKKPLFNMCFIITDFYLNQDQLNVIK